MAARCARPAGAGTALPFAITLDGRFVGHVMVGNVVREPLLSAYVGYWVDTAVAGAGRDHRGGRRWSSTTASGRSGCTGWRPPCGRRTRASLRVLAKLGFREEGLFRRYLDVDGAWRDHLCFALTAEDVCPAEAGSIRRWSRRAGVRPSDPLIGPCRAASTR